MDTNRHERKDQPQMGPGENERSLGSRVLSDIAKGGDGPKSRSDDIFIA
jgi:hypothetical protein